MQRKEVRTRIILADGTALNLRMMDGVLPEDLIIQGAKAEGYRIKTGRDAFPTVGRNIKDYLLRFGTITE